MSDRPQGVLGYLEESELPEVAWMEQAVFPEPFDFESLERLYRKPDVRYLAIREGDRLAAYFGFQVCPPTAHVLGNVTHPAFRRRGYGGRILLEAEPIAQALGARWFLGQVRVSNIEQRRVLARIGWREIALCNRFFGNGEDAYIVFHCFTEGTAP